MAYIYIKILYKCILILITFILPFIFYVIKCLVNIPIGHISIIILMGVIK